MTAFYKDLKLRKTSPNLWVKSLALYESQHELPIREISLRRGINVIWAHEPSNQGAKNGAELAGHGVGKTSFCLLLRYCICDQSKAVDVLREELVDEFPQGGVAATVSIQGTDWVVFRPYAKYKRSIAVNSSDMTDLFDEDIVNQFQIYEGLFSDTLLNSLESDFIPATGQKIQWQHILGWITRDQSARFLNYYHWREGEGAKLKRPKEDPPFLLRLALGLISEQEIGLLDKLKSAEEQMVKASSALNEYEKKPAYILSRIEDELRRWGNFSDDIPFKSEDLFSPSVESAVIEECNQEPEEVLTLKSLERDIEAAIIVVGTANKHHDSCKANKEIFSSIVKGNQADLEAAQNRKRNLLQLSGYCPICDLLFSQCSHVQEEANKLDIRLRRDQVGFSEMVQEYAPKLEGAESQLKLAAVTLSNAKQHLTELRRKQNALQTKIIDKRYRNNRAKDLLSEYNDWSKKVNARENPELDKLKEQLRSKSSTADSLKLKSEQIRQKRTAREEMLTGLVRTMAEALLGKDSFGHFDSNDTEFPFKLSVGCEAYRVLSVLLGDFAVLLFSAMEDTAFPGLLVHDCPREADMSEGLYQHFLEQLLSVEASLQNMPPYQYILTTTTPPPLSLQKPPFVRLELLPDDEDKMLFGKRFRSNSHEEIFSQDLV